MGSLANSMSAQLHHLAARMARESGQLLQEQFGIGFAQYKILLALREHGHVQQRVLAANLGQTEASISRQIHLLQAAGMLVAPRNPANMREHLADLTPRGEQMVEAAAQLLDTYHQSLFAGLTTRQQLALQDALAALRPTDL